MKIEKVVRHLNLAGERRDGGALMSDTLMLHLAFSVFVLDVTLLLMWRGKGRERKGKGRKEVER